MLFLLFDLIRLHSTCQALVVAINDIKLWRFYFPYGACGHKPSCAIMLSRSATPQCSTILLFSKRHISITVMAKDLSVGGRPMNAPRCVPRPVMRAQVLSPQAVISSMVKFKSGKGVRRLAIAPFKPSTVGGVIPSWCSMKLGAQISSNASRLPLLKPFSINCRKTCLLYSSDKLSLLV
jgi:hypothetical protein